MAVSFKAIREFSFILYEDGSVTGCGRNDLGQLGDGTDQDQYIATVELDDRVARLLGTGPAAHSAFFVTTDELVYGTGSNDRGQLGVDDTEDRNVPTRVMFGVEVLLVSTSAGEDHTLAIGAITGTTPPPAGAPSPL